MKNTRLASLPLWAAGLIACSAAACQDLGDAHTAPPALASIRGSLSLGEGVTAPEGDLRVAVLWTTAYNEMQRSDDILDPNYPCAIDRSKLPPDPNYWEGYADPSTLGYARFRTPFAEQEVEIDTAFPLKFRFDITRPPPHGTIDVPLNSYFDPSVMAEGQFIVYRDANHNGTLDPSTYAEPSADQILSVSAGPSPPVANPKYELEYIARRPVFDEKAARVGLKYLGVDQESLARYAHQYDDLDPGYNLVRPADPNEITATRLPDDTTVALVLNPNPGWQQVLCQDRCYKPDEYECPANPADLPERDSRSQDAFTYDGGSDWYYADGDTAVEASDSCDVLDTGIRTYSYSRWECTNCVCKVVWCNYQTDTLPEGAELPCPSK